MDEYKLKKIIEKLLCEHYEKKALVILTGGTSYSEELFKILLEYNNIKYDYMISENSLDIEEMEKWHKIGEKVEGMEEIKESIKKSEYIIIPFLTRNTLAKVALGIADNKVTTAIQLALMMDKTVISVDSSWNPETEMGKLMKINKNKAYNKMLFDYRTKVEELGMKSVSIYDLESEINRYLHKDIEKNEVDEENVESIYNSNESTNISLMDKKNGVNFITNEEILGKNTIYISKDDKLTDLAKEYVDEKRIKVIHK